MKLLYWRKYCKNFDKINKLLSQKEITNNFIDESITLNSLKLKIPFQNFNPNIYKCLNILLESQESFIMEKCLQIFHPERILAFSNNDNECAPLVQLFEKIDKFHKKEKVIRHIPRISEEEIKWYIGVIIYIGGCEYKNIEKAFLDDSILKQHNLSHRRFKEISRCIRFDLISERDQIDPLSPVKYIIEVVEKGIKLLYKPSNRFTIDEHIIPFTGAFKYAVSIKEKPHSRGIRVDCLNDCVTGYLYGFKLYSKSENSSTNEVVVEDDDTNDRNEEIPFGPLTQQQTQLSQYFTQFETQMSEEINTIGQTQIESQIQIKDETQSKLKRKRGRPKNNQQKNISNCICC